MTQYAMETISGSSLDGFDPAADSLLFPSSVSTRSLVVAASGADTVVSSGSYNVRLTGLLPAAFDGTQFIFSDGAVWRQGSSGDDSYTGALAADAFDLRAGGADTVNAGDGDDVIDLGGTLDATDSIDGQAGQADVVKLTGDYAGTLVLDDTMIRGVEQFVLATGGTLHLQLSSSLLASATPATGQAVIFDATAQTAASAVVLDGSLVLKSFQALMGAGDDTVLGGARNDTIKGGSGANFLAGHAGHDYLETASYGSSTLLGGAGDDTLAVPLGSIGTSAVLLAGGTGSDSLTGGEGNDTLYAAGSQDTIDEAVADEDWMVNRLNGGGGNDTLWGDAGRDTLIGAGGDDVLRGGGAQDWLDGGLGDDSLSGGEGDDTLDGGTGWDVLEGGSGNDQYRVREAEQQILEGADGGYDEVWVYGKNYTLGDNVEGARLTGEWTYGVDQSGRLVGNAQDNKLVGWNGNDTLEGGEGNDTLEGAGGVNSLVGGAGDDEYHIWSNSDVIVEDAGGGFDTVYVSNAAGYVLPSEIEAAIVSGYYAGELVGNAGDNILTSEDGGMTVKGLLGNDTLTAGGWDTLIGGEGDDTYYLTGGVGTVRELAGAGTDTVVAMGDSATIAANVENLVLAGIGSYYGRGNQLDNVIRGNDEANYLDGDAGRDTLVGGAGNDDYYVGDGNDVVVEDINGGFDIVTATRDYVLEANVERLDLYTFGGGPGLRGTGNALNNVITSDTQGKDTIDGGAGADTMMGGEGDDLYLVDNARDVIVEDHAYQGQDTVRSTVNYNLGDYVDNLLLAEGSSAIRGTGNDRDNRIDGNSNANVLVGQAGNDVLDGGAGDDRMAGGTGDDIYFVDSAGDVIVEAASIGYDSVRDGVMSTAATYQLGANVENLTLRGTGDSTGVGNELANRLQGNRGNNRLDGGAGVDTLAGGLGNDVYVVDTSEDRVTESLDGGTDTVLASASFTLGRGMENLTLTGAAAISGTGNTLDNLLRGNTAGNRLDGGAGADTLAGGRGDDLYFVDDMADVVTESADAGIDEVVATLSWVLGKNQEHLTLSGTRNISGTGNTAANVLTGNDGDNFLDGGAGADTLIGGAGGDTYVVDDARDVVWEASPYGGRDTVVATINAALGEHVENLVLIGNAVAGTGNSASNQLEGNAGNNSLDGGSANDTLLGGSGNDTLIGGLQADDLYGGDGNDRFVYRSLLESNLAAYDLIWDFTRGSDRIDLSQLDGNTGLDGRQALRLVAGQAGSAAGDMWIVAIDGGLALFANTDSDTAEEFVILVAGMSTLELADFVL